MDSSVLQAIKTAVEGDPENIPLRLHYASLLLAASKPADALENLATILARQPDHVEALKLAGDAAEAAGDPIRAHSYRKLHQALSWNSAMNLIESSAPPEGPRTETRAEPPLEEPFVGEEDDMVRLGADFGEDGPDTRSWETERPEVSLQDVAGMELVKKRLNTSFLGPMRNPDLRKLYGKSLRGGLLLYGPPGCGKTFIARAVAGELSARFMSIGITDVLDMYLGQSEKNLHSFFDSARRNRPCVVFMDEVDALGRKRSLMRHSAATSTISALLAELDGVQYDNEGLYMLAATNHPWDVDSALRRPGRLDRMILVLPPDEPVREAIVRNCLKDRPTKDIDFKWLAQKTDEFSGADVVHLCDSAAEYALEASIDSGVTRPITMNDFKQALKDVRPSTRTWFETARNHAIYANEGGIYDDLIEYLRKRRML